MFSARSEARESSHLADVLRRLETTKRNAALEPRPGFVLRLALQVGELGYHRRMQVRRQDTGMDRVDRDVVWGEFRGETVRFGVRPALGGFWASPPKELRAARRAASSCDERDF